MADPRFLEAWMGGRTDIQTKPRLNVRLDAPDGISYAPDQLDPHNSVKRVFYPPKLPEAQPDMYDFASEIAEHEGKPASANFVLEEETADETTPAQQLAALVRGQEKSDTIAEKTAEMHVNERDRDTALAEEVDAKADAVQEAGVEADKHIAANKNDNAKNEHLAQAPSSKSAAKKAKKKAKQAAEANNAENGAGKNAHATDADESVTMSTCNAQNSAISNDNQLPVSDVTTAPSAELEPTAPSAQRKQVAIAADVKTIEASQDVSEGTMDQVPLNGDAGSIKSAKSHAPSVAPTESGISIMSRTTHKSTGGVLPRVVRANLQVAPFQAPYDQRPDLKIQKADVWNTPTWSSFRSRETLSEQPIGRDAGTQWSDISSYASTTTLSQHYTPREMIAHLFVPDPRPWHPYRMVRRTNPRQVLLFCAGTALSAAEVRSAQAVRNALKERAAGADVNTKSLASYFGSTENTHTQGGIGFVFCPTKVLCNMTHAEIDPSRVEPNFSRRLERPDFHSSTTKQRATLRSSIAALEYHRWERDGFDKVVVATHCRWLARGISEDIWLWRKNGWMLTYHSPQGPMGDTVPNRDLWELLDYTIRSYEDIECV
ncbi:hypothetical protein MVES1_002200 [Malassezia vespertilionis]|uniref:uncharacterized protein n=1 Tax=Malassezia vespertilionis TaxID=2020962 RepID=UPI0024B23206|nr:uncharacterized protein MVES1_002200 [Malassezia vespertilionis]WFD06846.1 hypothetical protein MVES1_002200 [Malassezia vespertilionis]